jgi:SPP1 gp7 family putative phage head morphogenesis protein
MIALMNRFDADIVRRIQTSGIEGLSARDLRRLERTLERIRDINEATRKAAGEFLRPELVELAAMEADFQKRLFEQVTGGFLSFDGPTRRQVQAAALSRPFQGVHLRWATTSEHLREQYRRRGALLRDEIRRGFLEGDSVSAMVRRIRGTRAANFEDGILEISRRSANTMVRTAVNHTANASREIFYKENERFVKGVRWVSILDGRTSAICRARDGMVFDVDKGPRPPAHPNCRSTTVAVMKSFREVGIDADDVPGLDGKIPGRPTYNEWLKTQPREFVEDVLGKDKAKLYLEGNLTLDKFVDRAGAELTLVELRGKEAAAFKKAGL